MSAVLEPVTKLNHLVIRILGCNPGKMTLQGTNTYIVGSGNKRILIDTGEANKPNYIELLKSTLLREKIVLEHIVITHWHHDHVGGLDDIRKLIHNDDCKVWKFPRKDEPTTYHKLDDSQELKTEGATLKVIHTPGHTDDHVGLLLKEENILFSGDAVLGEGTSVFEDLYDYMKSLDKFLQLKPNLIFPGHGPVIKDGIQKIQEYIEHRNQREKQIMDHLASLESSTSSWDIVKLLYQDVPETLHPPAHNNVVQHLRKLEKESKVLMQGDKWTMKINY